MATIRIFKCSFQSDSREQCRKRKAPLLRDCGALLVALSSLFPWIGWIELSSAATVAPTIGLDCQEKPGQEDLTARTRSLFQLRRTLSQKDRVRGWLTYHVESDGLKQYAFPSDRFITGIPCCVSKICDTVMSLPRETAQEWVLGVF